jgi:precorrin-2 dehydrogenase/sirohydrochlorin ferrochelatase
MHPVPRACYPVVLTGLGDALCTVVGGGEVARRKVESLLEAGAGHIRVVAPSLHPALERLRDGGTIDHSPRRYLPGDLAGAFLAFAATDDPAVNRAVAAEAADRGVLVNAADAPALGSFSTPATVRRGDLLLSVSTGGASPTLAARISRDLSRRYRAEYGDLLALLRTLRPVAAARLAGHGRRCFWRSMTSRRVLAAVRLGRAQRVEEYAERLLARLSRIDQDGVEDPHEYTEAEPAA